MLGSGGRVEINIEINTAKNIDSVENLSARSEKFKARGGQKNKMLYRENKSGHDNM